MVLIGPVYPLRGGIAQYLAILYMNLREKGHQVEILSLKRQYPKFLFPGKSQEDTSKKPIKVKATPVLAPLNPSSWVRTFWEIGKRKPDLIVFKYWMPFFAPCYAAVSLLTKLFTQTKVLYICDNITPHERRSGDKLLTWLGLRFVDFFVVQSKIVREELLSFVPKARFKEVPHPIYDIFKRGDDRRSARKRLSIKEEKVILFFGYVRAYKGLGYLINAMANVVQKMKVKLLVVGEFYENRKKYDRQIRELGLKEYIDVVDAYIPNEEVGLYFLAADVVVLPYVSATQSGIVQIAYAFDKPVITTDVGGLPEVVMDGKTGFVVPAKDSEKLAEAIVKFYNEGVEDKFVESVRKEKEKYSWDRLIKAMEDLYGGQ